MIDLSSYTLQAVLIGSVLLGVVGGVVGSFALLRRQSLLGDALAHAALPGVCLGFLAAGTKAVWALSLGALFAGLIGALVIVAVVRGSRVKEDAAIGIVLSVFFGAGIVLLTRIQRGEAGNASGLDRFLFGQAATLTTADVVVIGVGGCLVLLLTALWFKELELLTFDRGFAASMGLPIRMLEVVLTALLVLVVVLGLQMVGVVLMVATLITPAAAARQWTDRLSVMVLLAAALGGLSGAIGAVASAIVPRLPTGPAIVVASSVALAISLLFAPQRGVVFGWIAEQRTAARIRIENLLKDLYRLGENRGELGDPLPWPLVQGARHQGRRAFARRVRLLQRRGWLARTDDTLQLTSAGVAQAAQVVRRHRLWELYLSRRLDLPADHLHRDAEAMEHVLSDETLGELDRLLGHPQTDPHGRPIPPAPGGADGPSR